MPDPLIVLASGSPQRRALLAALGLDFEVRVPSVEEETDGEPRDLVVRNALRKAEAVSADQPGTLVIAGDTEVVVDGEVLGQPGSEAEARAHLERLSGREHHVPSRAWARPWWTSSAATSRTSSVSRSVCCSDLRPSWFPGDRASASAAGAVGRTAMRPTPKISGLWAFNPSR